MATIFQSLDSVPHYRVYTGFVIAGNDPKALTIGHLAREVGINLETVRFYEHQGLLPKPPRSASGYRLFPADAARRLKFIKRAQELGFSLREIRELLELRVSPRTNSAEIRRRTESKIADIESKIKTLDSMRKSLRKLAESCAACAPHSKCPILDSLDGEDS
jgi:MerR family mercuric resistance operon transcriptional regulator